MRLFLPVLCGCLLAVGGAFSADVGQGPVTDEELLRRAGLAGDGAQVVEFFRRRTLGDADRLRLTELVKQLGADDFEVREQATLELKKLGPGAAPALRQALNDPDPEVNSRAKRCLGADPADTNLDVLAAAARALGHRPAAGAAGALLAYLPDVADDWLREEILDTLERLAARDRVTEAELRAAARDPFPVRRLAAARLLGRRGDRGPAADSGRLLADSDLPVRQETARRLVQAGDLRGVPVLISLLEDGPALLALEADEALRRTFGPQGPKAVLGSADTASRRACRTTWEAWWKARPEGAPPDQVAGQSLGLTLISECGENASPSRVWECAADGKPRWQLPARNPIAAQVLPNGRVLVADFCGEGQVVEFDRQGKVHWSRPAHWPVSCQRLANGNTFIATETELLEVTHGGRTVFYHQRPRSIYSAQKLETGNVLYLLRGGSVVEETADGRQVRWLSVSGVNKWGSCVALPQGNFLVSQYDDNKVVEVDGTGKVLWECGVKAPSWASRLPSGHTLVASAGERAVIEFDPAGKRVWELTTSGRPYFALRR